MNPCPHCAQPMTGRRVNHCGEIDCKRAWQRDRMREWSRQKTGYYDPKPTARCERCGAEFDGYGEIKRFCSRKCQNTRPGAARRRAQAVISAAAKGTVGDMVFIGSPIAPPTTMTKGAFRSQPSALTIAARTGDADAVIRILLTSTTPSGECRIWTGRQDTKGYPRVYAGGRQHAVHRLVAEATHGPLHGEPVHHRCATPLCVEPTHLQPVSERENIAEMIERNWYKRRIAELEEALEAVDATHPLIQDISPAA